MVLLSYENGITLLRWCYENGITFFMMKRTIYILGLLLCLVGCEKPHNEAENPTKSETQLDKGRCVFYGDYYAEEGIAHNVVDMDLLSANLSYDSVGRIVGTGTNLYFSDIFLHATDTLILAGVYTADTTAAVGTFLPGMDYEGGVSGAYLLHIVDNAVTKIILIEKGTFTLRYEGKKTHVDFDLVTTEGQAYKGTFDGELPMYALEEDEKNMNYMNDVNLRRRTQR